MEENEVVLDGHPVLKEIKERRNKQKYYNKHVSGKQNGDRTCRMFDPHSRIGVVDL